MASPTPGRMAQKCNTVVNFWLGWPKSAVLSSTFGPDGPKVLYCRRTLGPGAFERAPLTTKAPDVLPKCRTVANFGAQAFEQAPLTTKILTTKPSRKHVRASNLDNQAPHHTTTPHRGGRALDKRGLHNQALQGAWSSEQPSQASPPGSKVERATFTTKPSREHARASNLDNQALQEARSSEQS